MRAIFLIALCWPGLALAHFGLVLPANPMPTQEDGREVAVRFGFLHPFEQYGMELVPPQVVVRAPDGAVSDVSGDLTAAPIFGEAAYSATLPLTRPGAYAVGMTPQAYWEPAEDAFIIHYTKTYIGAFGGDEGWDAMLDLPVEIEPLTRPFGLWAGNAFQGVVRAGGEPVPFAEVEIEYWNITGAEAPSDLMITQVVKADANGVFTYVPPGSGWWGFSALVTADYTLPQDGVEKAVELGGVLWVHFEDWR